jgi:hypothetical protein
MAINSIDISRVEDFLSINNINKEDICLVGSISLAEIGIRENNDIDLILSSIVRQKKFNNIISNQIDIVISPWSNLFTDDEIIFNTDLHKIVNGYKIVIPELVYHKKIWLNRSKDQADILELNEYAKTSVLWNWKIITSNLPPNSIFRVVFKAVKNRLRIIRDRFRDKFDYSLNIHKDATQIIPTNLLLSKQIRSNKFNRYDIIVRYMAIESVFSSNDIGYGLYNRMQVKRGNTPHSDPLRIFQNLIHKIKFKGFDLYSPIIVDKHLNLVDGAHRLACALFFNIKNVPIRIQKGSFDAFFGQNWFHENAFNETEMKLIDKKKQEIFLSQSMYFEIILWPPAQDFFDLIEEDIAKECEIITYNTYSNIHIEPYIRELYKIDDIKEWKINIKIKKINKHPLIFRRILVNYYDPNFRHKDSNNHLISVKGEELKRKIRNKYKTKINDYFADIIIHSGDNFEHTRLSKQLAVKFEL